MLLERLEHQAEALLPLRESPFDCFMSGMRVVSSTSREDTDVGMACSMLLASPTYRHPQQQRQRVVAVRTMSLTSL